jgi:hypothetical protein
MLKGEMDCVPLRLGKPFHFVSLLSQAPAPLLRRVTIHPACGTSKASLIYQPSQFLSTARQGGGVLWITHFSLRALRSLRERILRGDMCRAGAQRSLAGLPLRHAVHATSPKQGRSKKNCEL